MGQKHAAAYAKIPDAHLVGVVDSDLTRASDVAGQHGCQAFGDTDELLKTYPGVAAVTVAVPTAHHVAAATPLIRQGVSCLVEKPLAPSPDQCRDLADLAQEHRVVLQVGHTERYNPAVRAVLGLGISARFLEVHRISPMTFRSLDVGVVMDLMIHDLDIVLTLAGSALKQVQATGVAVLGQHEDVANARLEFESGCVANVTASRLALKTERKLRVFSEDAYVSLDYARRQGIVIRKSHNCDLLEQVRRQLADGLDLSELDYSQLVSVDQLAMDESADGHGHDPLTAQLVDFLSAVRTKSPPAVGADAGLAAVDAAPPGR